MTRFIALSIALIAALSAAHAQTRPDSRALYCDEVRSLIQDRGAVVLTTGRHTYDRYVAGLGFCPAPYEPVTVAIATRDTPQCPVYRCGEPLFDDDF